MTSIDEMDEFVDWADAEPLPAGQLQSQRHPQQAPPNLDPNLEMDLVFANVYEDDFSFFALQHFAGEAASAAAQTAPFDEGFLHAELGEPCESPCTHCADGGFQCKRIQEGHYKGYCTSCVALRCDCSFGSCLETLLNSAAITSFPANPWPTLGNHSNLVPQLEDLVGFADGGSSGISALISTSAPDLPSMTALAGEQLSLQSSPTIATANDNNININNSSTPLAKIGARFSRDSVRILKNWLSSHTRHPYPSDEEKEMLQRQTGLNKTQITNWLANARRRGKIVAPRSTSPHVGSWSTSPIDIPPRRAGTPALEAGTGRMLNPLERWVDSPPENEPASVTAIARAITASRSGVSSGLNSPFSYNYTDDGSGRSLCNASSTSSLGTSHSSGGGSFASAYSHGSRGSFGSGLASSFSGRGRRRRRRRAAPTTGPLAGEEKGAPAAKSSLGVPLKTFQCTFCTETFRTKHDWQRHEKSLHLSLERWVCAPDGPRAVNQAVGGGPSCVFCGEANPDEAHVESHNFSNCTEKSLEERTFYRKDHLNQHLKLVHGVRFLEWAMKPWKVATPEIRSRCGFCGIVMDTWTIRVDHLAEHFKTGNTMADWKGDWGFEAPVLDMVENSIPPYLIHDERNSPLPYVANAVPPESPRNAYELIKMELVYFATNLLETAGRLPTDEELQREACRIIFASEVLSLREISSTASWLRDIVMSSDDAITRQAQFGPLRSQAESRLSLLKINGKDNLFEACPLEQQLHEFVKARYLLGLTAMDRELQEEACNIIGRMEEVSTNPSDGVANWLVRFVNASPAWLANFRARAHLPRSEDLGDERLRSRDPTTIDSTIHNYSRLERELGDYLVEQRALGVAPADIDLQRQARIIIYEFDDGWNQTAADNEEWLENFKARHGLGDHPAVPTGRMASKTSKSSLSSSASGESLAGRKTTTAAGANCPVGQGCDISPSLLGSGGRFGAPMDSASNCPVGQGCDISSSLQGSGGPTAVASNCPVGQGCDISSSLLGSGGPMAAASNCPVGQGCDISPSLLGNGGKLGALMAKKPDVAAGATSGHNPFQATPFFLNDANCYRRLERQLTRYVMQTMSPNNPNQHVPTDKELQHQARWILYDDDDPWNQTAADNAEWLLRFKRDVGITKEDGPGLAPTISWAVQQGGTGFAPPYAFPKELTTGAAPDTVQLLLRDAAKPFEARGATVNKFLESFTSRYPPPATVFCSRELETGLADFVRREAAAAGGRWPDDAALQAKGREILGMERTPAEDPVLLEKFKAWMAGKVPSAGPDPAAASTPAMLGLLGGGSAGADGGAALPMDVDMNVDVHMSDEELNTILQDMNFELDVELAPGASVLG